MNKRIWLSLAHMGGREQDFIKEAFDTNWVALWDLTWMLLSNL